MAKSKLYCLSIKPILVENKAIQAPLYPMPLYCLSDFNASLISCINSLIDVLNQHQLTEVSKKITGITWFFELTNRYHIDIPTYIHVTESTAYFTGYLPPYKQKYFRTSEVPLDEILENGREFKAINLANLQLPFAKAIASELEAQQTEFEKINDRYFALDEVRNALANLNEDTVEQLNSSSSECLTELAQEMSHLNNKNEAIELTMEELSKKLLYRTFGLTIGDWICTDSSWHEGRKVQLKIDRVDYYSSTLTLSGLIITQKGEIGKREESIRINLCKGSEDEYK
ncbi:hypothetical protein H4J38_06650 [Colwellia sp. BRX10-3]|uniref:hypothetical protein n=1 Tax=Colwellia sp. BRX10-3 TaxID=2759844 RepID=UPI0015F3E765|nr:hypothetical protein [Colwellia sp. BRX10-3]MBA6390461.1 hypothetical protein [Colwellia sp. BRX10-3]